MLVQVDISFFHGIELHSIWCTKLAQESMSDVQVSYASQLVYVTYEFFECESGIVYLLCKCNPVFI